MSKKIRLGYDILSKRAIETESGVNIDDALRSISSYQKVPGVGIDNHPDVPRPSTKILYIVKVASAGQPDTYKEWIWNQPSDGQGYWECTGDTSQDLSVYALKFEMSVVPGTGADADKTTITLKDGTSATVLTSHQGLGDYVSVNPQSFTSDEKAAARANIGAAEDTAVQKIMIGEGQASKSGFTFACAPVSIPFSLVLSVEDISPSAEVVAVLEGKVSVCSASAVVCPRTPTVSPVTLKVPPNASVRSEVSPAVTSAVSGLVRPELWVGPKFGWVYTSITVVPFTSILPLVVESVTVYTSRLSSFSLSPALITPGVAEPPFVALTAAGIVIVPAEPWLVVKEPAVGPVDASATFTVIVASFAATSVFPFQSHLARSAASFCPLNSVHNLIDSPIVYPLIIVNYRPP